MSSKQMCGESLCGQEGSHIYLSQRKGWEGQSWGGQSICDVARVDLGGTHWAQHLAASGHFAFCETLLLGTEIIQTSTFAGPQAQDSIVEGYKDWRLLL